MEDRFIPPTRLAPSYLNANTPLGLFQAIDHKGPAELFWVLESDGERLAICLDTEQTGQQFQFWALGQGDTSWFGVARGPVEILLDLTSLERSEGQDLAPGIVFITNDGAYLQTWRGSRASRVNIRLGDVMGGADPSAGVRFLNWRLVQRDARGKAHAVFERAAPEPAIL